MPPPEVLAQLQQATVDIQPEADEPEAREVEIPEKKLESDKPDVVPAKMPEAAGPFKAPEAFKVPEQSLKKEESREMQKKPAAPAPKFGYREPHWTGICPDLNYKLEVLKGGKIIGEYMLDGKSCHVLGKLETCDLRMEHPSISRYHAILQWHASGNGGK